MITTTSIRTTTRKCATTHGSALNSTSATTPLRTTTKSTVGSRSATTTAAKSTAMSSVLMILSTTSTTVPTTGLPRSAPLIPLMRLLQVPFVLHALPKPSTTLSWHFSLHSQTSLLYRITNATYLLLYRSTRVLPGTLACIPKQAYSTELPMQPTFCFTGLPPSMERSFKTT